MRRTILLAILSAALAQAESYEFGAAVGGGAIANSSAGAAGGARLGLEACFFCGGRLALFGEYGHWFSAEHQTGYGTFRVSSADLAGGGLRIQSRGRWRAFFDVGVVGGSDEHGNGGGGAIGGIVVAGGFAIPVNERWYVRPQVRIYGLSPHTLEGLDAHWALSAGAGFGYRF